MASILYRSFPGILLLLLPAGLRAQFKITAEVRPRFELRDGFKRPLEQDGKAAFFIEQRTRLYLEYKTDQLELVLVPQDVRFWGNTDQVYKEDPSLTNLQQAWAAYRFDERHKVAMGRMELNYDNARILGDLSWAQQSRSHDLVKYEFRQETFSLHLGAAFNQDSGVPEPGKLSGTDYVLNNYKTMQFLWLHKTAGKARVSLLFLNDGRQYAPDTVYFMQTAGLFAGLQAGPAAVSGEFYYQAGKNGSGRETGAMLASLSAAVKAGEAWTLGLGTDYLSGDKSATTRNEAFDPLYGTHHKFYGFMDYFYVGNGHGNRGLWDLYGKAGWKTGKKGGLDLQVHRFSAAADIPADDAGNHFKKNFGTEADLSFSYAVDKAFKIQGGYSRFFFTESLERVKGVSNPASGASWAWLMVTFKPVLLDHKEEK